MIFETHTLKAPLNKYIESIFHFKGFMPDHSIERVVPTGHLFILFELVLNPVAIQIIGTPSIIDGPSYIIICLFSMFN